MITEFQITQALHNPYVFKTIIPNLDTLKTISQKFISLRLILIDAAFKKLENFIILFNSTDDLLKASKEFHEFRDYLITGLLLINGTWSHLFRDSDSANSFLNNNQNFFRPMEKELYLLKVKELDCPTETQQLITSLPIRK